LYKVKPIVSQSADPPNKKASLVSVTAGLGFCTGTLDYWNLFTQFLSSACWHKSVCGISFRNFPKRCKTRLWWSLDEHKSHVLLHLKGRSGGPSPKFRSFEINSDTI